MSDHQLETVQIPARMTDLIRRRTQPILHASIHYPNALWILMASCYLQGLEDGYAAKFPASPERGPT